MTITASLPKCIENGHCGITLHIMVEQLFLAKLVNNTYKLTMIINYLVGFDIVHDNSEIIISITV